MWVSPTKKVLLLDIFTQGCLSCTLEVHKLTGLMHISWCDLPCSFKRNFSVTCFLQLYTLLICAVCFVSFFPCSTTAQKQMYVYRLYSRQQLANLWHSVTLFHDLELLCKDCQEFSTSLYNWWFQLVRPIKWDGPSWNWKYCQTEQYLWGVVHTLQISQIHVSRCWTSYPCQTKFFWIPETNCEVL